MGITLAEARERLGEAKRMVADGKLPAREKTRDKARVKGAGAEEAKNAIHCVAPVGEKAEYVDQAMRNILPYVG